MKKLIFAISSEEFDDLEEQSRRKEELVNNYSRYDDARSNSLKGEIRERVNRIFVSELWYDILESNKDEYVEKLLFVLKKEIERQLQ